MGADTKAPPPPPHDPIEDMARTLYIEICGRVFSEIGGDKPKPQPRALAQLSFKLAEIFQAANYEFNPTAIAAREAKAKASVNLDSVQLDFGAPAKK
jgi:hypothetical protein